MESMTFDQFRSNVQSLSNIKDKASRDSLYATVLRTLHDEAVFLPITAKRQTAATNVRVSGFQFGYMEFDLPLANLFPTGNHSATFQVTIAGTLSDITEAKRLAHKTAIAAQLSVHKSKIAISYSAGSIVMTVTVQASTTSEANTLANTMSALTPSALGTALGETVTATSTPTTSATQSSSSNDDLSTGAIVGIAVAAGAAVLFLLCTVCLICREKQGKPIFTNLESPSKTSAAVA